MKTLLSVAAATIAFSVMGVQQVGVTAITTTNKNTIVSVPFTSLGGGETITAKELVKTRGLVEGTQLYVFSGGSYTAWVLSGNEWVAAATSYLNDQGATVNVPADTNTALAPGDAIWLIRPSADTAASKTFYVYGTPWAPTTKTIANGYNLVANPRQAAKTFTVANPVSGDQILIPEDGSPRLYTYKTRVVNEVTEGQWRKNGTTATLPSIDTGLGFWYISKGSGATTITWAD